MLLLNYKIGLPDKKNGGGFTGCVLHDFFPKKAGIPLNC